MDIHTQSKWWIIEKENGKLYFSKTLVSLQLILQLPYPNLSFFMFSIAFPTRNIHYLVGLNDSLNCDLDNSTTYNPTTNSWQGCNDNDLATYCQAMLQGNDRLDRFAKWRQSIGQVYHTNEAGDTSYCDLSAVMVPSSDYIPATCSRVMYVPNIGHDFVGMLNSQAASCFVFNQCSAL